MRAILLAAPLLLLAIPANAPQPAHVVTAQPDFRFFSPGNVERSPYDRPVPHASNMRWKVI